jgi:hypothetical protein
VKFDLKKSFQGHIFSFDFFARLFWIFLLFLFDILFFYFFLSGIPRDLIKIKNFFIYTVKIKKKII